jgi:hypothetical protein
MSRKQGPRAAGMRPAANAVGRGHDFGCSTTYLSEASA